MGQLLNAVSAVTTSFLASLQVVIAADLVLLPFWVLGEMAYSVRNNYPLLALLIGFTFIAALGVTIVRLVKPQYFGVSAAHSGSLNVLSLAALDLALILAVILIADQLQKPLTTPVLHFCQIMLHKLTG